MGWFTDWLKAEDEPVVEPTECENCGKPLATARAAHTLAGLAACCPDCLMADAPCGCPS